ncbi:MAG TPA: FAD-binding oxidoreductase [Planktothrix sp.]|jgi:sarcosine oxidase
MNRTYKHIVVGKGLIGAAATRHLSEASVEVAAIGPDEPADWTKHDGPFASHFDSGRITRILDTSLVWATLAKRSIERYRSIEEKSQMSFFQPVGCVKVVPDSEWGRNYITANRQIGDTLRVQYEILNDAGLRARFPYLHFAANSLGIFETETAGWINPRTLVAGQLKMAERNGAAIIRETVIERRERGQLHELVTDAGNIYSCENVLIAAGSYSNFYGLARPKLNVIVRAETTVLAKVQRDEQADLERMPSVIMFFPEDAPGGYVYMVPPAMYPDGQHYLKMGGHGELNHLFHSLDELRDWFHSPGDATAAAVYRKTMSDLLSDFKLREFYSKPCIITDTVTDMPYIGRLDKNVFVATGGCGAAAKSSDEIGRLGAQAILSGENDPAYDGNSFDIVREDDESRSKRKFQF